MVCTNLSALQCAYLLDTRQDIKLFFLIGIMLTSLFFVFKMKDEKIEYFKKYYYVMPLKVTRMMSFIYLFMSPFSILVYTYDLSYELSIGYYMLYYMPTFLTIISMVIMFFVDRIFMFFGFKDFANFYKSVRGK